jgi:ABC-type Fe3+/spermidine/putrescine transport system ATPase subunit
MLLELQDLDKSFDNLPVLRSITFGLDEGEIVVLLGPSGCGKTTLLRIIAGLEEADEGRVLLDGQDLTRMPVYQRGFGFLFQDYALFPHKNVAQNVAFGLRMLTWDRSQIARRVEQVLELVGLSGFSRRSIFELSGGEQQRVALARSLAPAPRLLLLDEPLGALDRALRERLMLELRAILKQAGGTLGRPEGITAIYVTHDQSEAFAIADRIAIMNQGRIEQLGAPAHLYRQPATAFVARFLGMDNLVQGEIVSSQPWMVRTELGELEISEAEAQRSALTGHRVTLLIRPEAARLVAPGATAIAARLVAISFRGRYQIVTMEFPGTGSSLALQFEFESSLVLPAAGSTCHIALQKAALVLLTGGKI